MNYEKAQPDELSELKTTLSGWTIGVLARQLFEQVAQIVAQQDEIESGRQLVRVRQQFSPNAAPLKFETDKLEQMNAERMRQLLVLTLP